MNKWIFLLSISLMATATTGCNKNDGLKSPGPINPLGPSLPSSEPSAPLQESTPPVQEPEAAAPVQEQSTERSISGQVVKIWNLIFPSAYAAEVIDVYRFKTTDKYELMGTFPVSEKGEFSIKLKQSEVNDYMLHLILKEESMKWGIREKIVAGDSDQVITLDAFTAVETRFEKSWMTQTNSDWKKDKKPMDEETLKELITAIDEEFAVHGDWQAYIKNSMLVSLENSLDSSVAESLVPFMRGEEEALSAVEKIQKIKKEKKKLTYHTFGICTIDPKEQKILIPEERKEKVELWLEAADEFGVKVLGKKADRIFFDYPQEANSLLQDISMKMSEIATTHEMNFTYQIILKDKNSQHEEACEYQTQF